MRKNNNNTYLTGCGADQRNAAAVSSCNSYETANGQASSTTGNISGVYDTVGGAWDIVAGVMKAENDIDLSIGASKFDQAELNQIGAEGKYLDVYDYEYSAEDRSRGHLGDATLEMGPFNSDRGAWYNNFAKFVSFISGIWFVRGADFSSAEIANPLSFSRFSGMYSSYLFPEFGSRIVAV